MQKSKLTIVFFLSCMSLHVSSFVQCMQEVAHSIVHQEKPKHSNGTETAIGPRRRDLEFTMLVVGVAIGICMAKTIALNNVRRD